MTYVESKEIERSAEAILHSLEEVEHSLYNFQSDMDSNHWMRENLDWDCEDLRKSLERTILEAKELTAAASAAADTEYDDPEEEED